MLPESCLSFIASTNRGNWSLVPLFTPHFPSSCSSLQLSYWVKRDSEGEYVLFVCLFKQARRQLVGCSWPYWMRLNSQFQCFPRAVCHLLRPLIVGTGVWSPYLRHISRLLALVSSFHTGLKGILKGNIVCLIPVSPGAVCHLSCPLIYAISCLLALISSFHSGFISIIEVQ